MYMENKPNGVDFSIVASVSRQLSTDESLIEI
jgi:hypothetical protein